MAGACTFLLKEDKLKLQAMFGDWNTLIKPNKLIEPLFEKNMITEREKQELNAIKTEYGQNEYIFDKILMKAPYEELEVIYTILMSTNDGSQMGIAARLPRKPSGAIDNVTEETTKVPIQATSEDDTSQGLARSFISSQPQPGLLDAAGNTSPRQDSLQSSSVATPLPGQGLKFYRTKPHNNQYLGKGICVIIANFTGHLPGYQKDISSIKTFFERNLGYEVFGGDASDGRYHNLTQDQMVTTLKYIQDKLCSTDGAKIDRFFLFILSHGDENGIKTCAMGRDDLEETNNNGATKYISPEEIAKMFTHDKVKGLKGFPKCIFSQNCRGAEDVQHAARTEENQEAEDSKPSSDISIGADVLFCHATKLGKLSWVNLDGSWFIQTIIETFQQYYESEHIIDMIGEVNNLISQKLGYGEVQGSRRYVKQFPDTSFGLRRKFYLSIPRHLLNQ